MIMKEKSSKNKNSSLCVRKFIEYCKRTDLHGYKYIVMKDLNVPERCFWAVAVLMSIVFSIYLVITAYRWFARNPIMTVIESTQGPIWDIPFPAVTICSLNVVSRRAARFVAHNLTLPKNVTAEEVYDIFRLVPLLHSSFVVSLDQRMALHKLQIIMDINHISVETLFRMLSPAATCGMLLERCMWKNTLFRCDVLFESLFTHFGLCCTFNYYAVDADVVSNTKVQKTSWPRRVASCGYQTALSVLVNTDPEDYHSSILASKGALVLIDNTYNIPNVDSSVRMVNPTTEVLMALSPEMTYTTPGVRKFKPEERQCFYSEEVKIGVFRQYSFHNCIAYQRMESIRRTCECIPYFFPLNDYHRTCNFNDVECLGNVLMDGEPVKTFTCLPECEHYDYPVEAAFGKLALHIKLQGLPLFDDIYLENRSVINVFFNDLVSTRYRRDVYLNWQNLLASFGGLLSLMLGFTLIAGFDLIIFFTFGIAYGTFEKAKQKNSVAVKPETDYEEVHFEKTKEMLVSGDINKQIVIHWNELLEDKTNYKREYGKGKKPKRY